MKKLKKFYILLIWALFLLSLVGFAIAEEKKDYVGINKSDEYVWLVDFNETIYDDMEKKTDFRFDIKFDKDAEAGKIKINYIKEEQEYYYGNGVEIEYINYYTENRSEEDWEQGKKFKKIIIYSYDKDNTLDIYKEKVFDGALFVSKNVDWDELIKEIDNDLENGKAEYKNNEIYIKLFFERIEIKSRYNSDGVNEFFEIKYDGDRVFKLELEYTFFHEYLMITAIILIIALIPLAILIFNIIKKRRYKKEKEIIELKEENMKFDLEQENVKVNLEPEKEKFIPKSKFSNKISNKNPFKNKKPVNKLKRDFLIVSFLVILIFPTLFYYSNSRKPLSNIPTVYITHNDSLNNSYFVDCVFELEHEYVNGRMRIRGSSGSKLPKTGFRLELFRRKSFLGMRRDDDWQLFAMARDYSRLRYKLAFDLWRSLQDMDHSVAILPKSKFVNLYLNGKFHGLYLFAEKNDRKLFNLDDAQDNINSSLIFQAKGYTTLRYYTGWKQDWPNEHEGIYIMENIMRGLIDYIKYTSNEEFFNGTINIYSKFDKLNLIDFYLFNFFILHKDFWDFNYFIVRNTHPSKFFLIPWDFDISFGQNKKDMDESPTKNHDSKIKRKNVLYRKLLKNEDFREECTARWKELREKLWTEDFILDMIIDMYEEVKDSLERDINLWQPSLSPEDYYKDLIKWIPDRLEFCDSYFAEY